MPIGTVNGGDTYFATRLRNKVWFANSSSKKQLGLNDSGRLINSFAYLGCKTDPEQDDEWPREGIILDHKLLDKTITPDDIVCAYYEIANALLSGFDIEKELRSINVTSRAISSVRTTYDIKEIPEFLELGIPSVLAWRYLSPYFNRHLKSIKLNRVS